MFFRKKGRLRKEFDEKLISQLTELKMDWMQQKSILEKSFDPSEEIFLQAKLSEAKYFFMFKEAKKRKVTIAKR